MRSRKVGFLVTSLAMVSLLAGCGRVQVTPTPLPASFVRPEQPAPVYAVSTAFTLVTPTVVPQLVIVSQADAVTRVTDVATSIAPLLPFDRAQIQSPLTGLGIVRGGAVLLDTPNGAVRQQLPAGAVVTLTGKSVDAVWLAAYTERGESGWLAANRLALFGTETLTVVTEALGPGLAATLVAEALEPLVMPTIMLTATVAP